MSLVGLVGAALCLFGNQSLAYQKGAPIVPRFEFQAPLPTIPPVMIDSFTTGGGLASETARSLNLQGRVIWIDATANIDRYNTEAKIVSLVRKIRDVGFNTIVFDVKPISGQTVYPSRLAPRLQSWRGQSLPPEFDPLDIMVREAKANGLSLLVSLNAFSEGHRLFTVGPGYSRTPQQTVVYQTRPVIRDESGTSSFAVSPKVGKFGPTEIGVFTEPESVPRGQADAFALSIDRFGVVLDGFEAGGTTRVPPVPRDGVVLYGQGPAGNWLRQHLRPGSRVRFDSQPSFTSMAYSAETQIPLMMNPNDPQVRSYILGVAEELVSKYNVDGLLFDDRYRYAGLDADFSEITRNKFEEEVTGHPITWPDDVFKYTYSQNLTRGIQPGRFFDAWMSWRAQQLHDFMQTVRMSVRTIRPKLQVGLYVGSWYGDYPSLGDNYAAPGIDAGFWFLTPAYAKAGLAPVLDFLITGCYYTTSTIYEGLGRGLGIGSCVEAAGSLTNRLVRDQTWTYAGISLIDFENNPDGLLNALQAACASTEGVMVFDLSHNIEPMWPVFARAFGQRRTPPHLRPDVLASVRQRRASLDRMGVRDRAVTISAGSSGTGQ